MLHQPGQAAGGQLTNPLDAQLLQPGTGFGTDAIDLAARQGPDARGQVLRLDDGDAMGFFEFAGHLGQQLVGGHPHGTGQARLGADGGLDARGQHAPTLVLAAGHLSEVDVDLVHAAVLHHRRDGEDDLLEGARKLAVARKVDGQQDGLRAQARRLHHAHG